LSTTKPWAIRTYLLRKRITEGSALTANRSQFNPHWQSGMTCRLNADPQVDPHQVLVVVLGALYTISTSTADYYYYCLYAGQGTGLFIPSSRSEKTERQS
jgi:hypothetical protein